MQFAIAIFTIGAVLVLIGLVGGDLSYRGLTVPKVGPLPRFTTTVTGGVFLAISLVVFLTAEFGHLDPGPANDPVGSYQNNAGQTQTDLSVVDAVTVELRDQLTDGALQEQIEVSVDGAYVGTLSADLATPEAALRFPVTEDVHSFAMAGVVQFPDGSEVPVAGEGTFTAGPGASFDLIVSEAGELGLSQSN
jgi:hypothetical protein